MTDAVPLAAAVTKPERVFTWPLVAFLVLVAGVVGSGLLSREPRLDLPGTVQLLGDGDLDGDERVVQLARLRGFGGGTDLARWAALLACIELEDRDGHAAAVAALGGEPWRHLPSTAERRFLHLGNPLLGNVLAAAEAEGGGDRSAARVRWAQVAAQAHLMAKSFAAELAAAAVARLQ